MQKGNIFGAMDEQTIEFRIFKGVDTARKP